jgi:hypothetical protein
VIDGQTVRLRTQCGSLFVTLNIDNNGELLEVLGVMGKAGWCMRANIQGLTRLVTLALKYRVPVKEIVDELEDIACPSEFAAEHGVKSCPDGIARALKEFLKGNSSEMSKEGNE